MLPKLHFTEDTFALKFLLQGAERLLDVVVANIDLHVVVTTFLG
ncbi:30S ribosomal protein S21 [Paracoccus sp. SM22M-07]|nr:30S ribosomal protein S21 [Paracoccus sp. SM22M-07]